MIKELVMFKGLHEYSNDKNIKIMDKIAHSKLVISEMHTGKFCYTNTTVCVNISN